MDPTKKELYTTKRSSGIDYSDAIEPWAAVKSDARPENWYVVGSSRSAFVCIALFRLVCLCVLYNNFEDCTPCEGLLMMSIIIALCAIFFFLLIKFAPGF
jgi:hypothetical protein